MGPSACPPRTHGVGEVCAASPTADSIEQETADADKEQQAEKQAEQQADGAQKSGASA